MKIRTLSALDCSRRHRLAGAVLCAAAILTATDARGQILQVQPPSSKKQDSKSDIKDLVKLLQDDKRWWGAAKKLIASARKHRIAVLTQVNAVARGGGEAWLKERAQAVVDRAVQDYLQEHKDRERKEHMQNLRDAMDDLRDATASERAAAMRSLEKAVAAMAKSLATDKPLKAPRLGVPTRFVPPGESVARKARDKNGPAKKAGGKKPEGRELPKGALDGYRRVKVGDRTVLVPKKDMPEGGHFHVEMQDGGGVRVMRFKSKADKERYLKSKKSKKSKKSRKSRKSGKAGHKGADKTGGKKGSVR